MDWKDASAYCASLQLGGYQDWRLPRPEEIKAIYHCELATYQCHDIAPDKMVPAGTVWSSEEYAGRAFTLCTRPMGKELLQIAKDAQVTTPISDLVMLKAYIPLSKARLAYQLGQFQDSIAQARNSLAIKTDFAPADWAIGISYGRLGQWNLAISNLTVALKIDKNYEDAKNALKWAKDGQKAAQTGKPPKIQTPVWN